MKLSCDASMLAKAMKHVASVSAKGHAIAVLANVLMECDGETLHLTTSNGDQWLTRTLKVAVSAPGGITVEASRLAAVLSALDSGATCELTAEGDALTVKAGRSRFRFGTLPVSHFPRPLIADGKPEAFGDDLFGALRAVRHAVGTNVTLPGTLGVFLSTEGGKLYARASDGSRAAKWAIPNAPTLSALLPTSCVDHVLRMADDFDATVDVVTTDRLVSFDFGNAKLVSKMLDAVWPLAQIDRITPTDFGGIAKLPREQLSRAVARLALIDDGKDRAVQIDFASDRATLTSLVTRDAGEEWVPCEYEGEPFRIGLRTSGVLQASDALASDEITLSMNGQNDPVMITAADRPDGSIMVMPYRIAPVGEN